MRFRMRLLVEDINRSELINKMTSSAQYKQLQDICNRHNVELIIQDGNEMQLEIANEAEISIYAEYLTDRNEWVISVDSIIRAGLDKFSKQLSKVEEFFSCIQEATAVDIKKIYA